MTASRLTCGFYPIAYLPVGRYRLCSSMNSVLLAFVVGFAVSQVATLVTTLYLHRTLSHRAITMRPVAGVRVPGRAVDDDRDPSEGVGRGAPQAPCLHRRGGRPALAQAPRLDHRAVRQRRAVPQGRDRPEQVRRYARDLPQDRWDRVLFDRSWLGLTIGISFLVVVFGPIVGLLAAGIHAVLYLGLNAAVNAITHTFGRAPVRQHRHEPPVAGVAHARRGPAQQPPRRADVGEVRARTAARSTSRGR